MIAEDSIEGLKARLDIVDIVGNYLELKKAGVNFKAVCPFHDEKSPSFVISPQKQIYHCFGCGAGGDAIRFVMEYEKLSYPEAIEKLAAQSNFTLHYSSNAPKQNRSKVLESLQDYYSSLLDRIPQVRRYLQERGIYESSIEHFGIGYAPASQQSINYLISRHFPMNEAVELGVIGQENGRTYARFIERITFPIHTANGTIVGFGGRTITGHAAKYVNSPQTKLFNKSRLLYAYHLAKDTLYRKKEIIVTEGYLDVVMLHQAGFTNAVATLGTALTADHLPLLRKGDPRVIVAYDGDKAGRAAAFKAAKLLSAAGFDGGVVLFEGGLDPADMVKEGHIEQLAGMFRSAIDFIEFVLRESIAGFDLRNPKAKEQAMNEAIAYLKTLSPLLQEEYKSHLSSLLGISPSLIRLGAKPVSNNTPSADAHNDTLELMLIKTLIDYPQFTEQLLDFIDPSMLQFHAEELSLCLDGQLDHPKLMAIAVNTSIKPLHNNEALKAELAKFLMPFYNRELKRVTSQSDISFEKKSFLIRKYRDKLVRLKRGELVTFES